MKYLSSRDFQKRYNLSHAIRLGLAPDGGLFVPESFPHLTIKEFLKITAYPQFCNKMLLPFFENDQLAPYLPEFCKAAVDFEVPIKKLDANTYVMELFYGPTLSFKDFGARFLAQCLNKLAQREKITIMVATSGDTGSAVASAFYNQPHIDVIILFPKGQISERQQQQITCWGKNIKSYAVKGSFDDCQRLVKSAFDNPKLKSQLNLCTANSINIGRLLPQMCYYAFTSVYFYRERQISPNFIVPSGNFGNVTAAYWAKQIGFPIQKIVMATNANQVITDYLESGKYTPRPSIQTLANAMDVGNPSNFERLQYLFKSFENFKQHVSAYSVSDELIKASIKDAFEKYNYILCPHTATAYWARKQCNEDTWVITSTADPCKFDTIIEPLIEQAVPLNPTLSALLNRQSEFTTIEPKLEAIFSGLI